jgi:hypothetical protein
MTAGRCRLEHLRLRQKLEEEGCSPCCISDPLECSRAAYQDASRREMRKQHLRSIKEEKSRSSLEAGMETR